MGTWQRAERLHEKSFRAMRIGAAWRHSAGRIKADCRNSGANGVGREHEGRRQS
jgi:hypothetical protein